MIQSVPKLISNIADKDKPIDHNAPLVHKPSRSALLSALLPGLGQAYNGEDTKAFLLLSASITSGFVLGFLFLIANLSTDALITAANFLESIPFLDVTLSQKTFRFVYDLQFPNPFTIAILIACLTYTGFAVSDAVKTALNLQKEDKEIIPEYKRESFYESSAISYGIHMFLLLMILISGLLFVKPKKPEVQITQIEFIPTQKVSKKAPPKSTKRRAAKQSIDSGKNDPKRKVTPITKAPGKPGRGATAPKAAPKPKPKAAPKKPTAKPKAAPKKTFKPLTKTRPSPKPVASSRSTKRSAKPKRFIPAPSTYKASDSGAKPKSSPAPRTDLAGTRGTSGDRNSSLVARLSNIPRLPSSGTPGQGGAYGAQGNPGKNPYADQAPSVAARQDINFGPYMSALQRKIKLAWKPPRGTESSRIVVVFAVGQDGALRNLDIVVSSGIQSADEAARAAVRRASPFKPLPPGAPDEVDVEFTFDYNVFQKSRF